MVRPLSVLHVVDPTDAQGGEFDRPGPIRKLTDIAWI
jgi:hypothetical protein